MPTERKQVPAVFYKPDSDRIDIAKVIEIVRDEEPDPNWDDTNYTLPLLDHSYSDDVPMLIDLARSKTEDWTVRTYAIDALSLIGESYIVMPVFADLLTDKNTWVRGEAIVELRECEPGEFPIVIPPLIKVAMVWDTSLSACIAAFHTLVKLLGFRGAVSAVFRGYPGAGKP